MDFTKRSDFEIGILFSKENYINIATRQSYKPPKLSIGNDVGIFLNNKNNIQQGSDEIPSIISRSINLFEILY
jgi:hypothetical protein